MKEDVGIVITNNYNIACHFEYCLLLDTIPAENVPEFFKNRIITRIIKKHLKK